MQAIMEMEKEVKTIFFMPGLGEAFIYELKRKNKDFW